MVTLTSSKLAGGRRTFLICLGLALATAGVYWRVHGFEFVNFDDPDYVTLNPHVRSGLTSSNIIWALTSGYAANWHPLTWISHMLDCQLYGLHAGGHHITNLLLHVANTLLVFGVLRRMTGNEWRSAMVAGLFGLHPMHVESVAWVTERKDVLSTLFGLLTLWAWWRHVGQPSRGRYALALAFFALGLMAKPMLVTLPLLMLLLDYWPMNRLPAGSRLNNFAGLVREKIPFFLLAAASCVVTFLVQRAGGAVASEELVSPEARIENALVGYVRYVGKLIWPENLAAFYPSPKEWDWAEVAGAGAVLLVITVVAVWQRRRHPCLIAGWLWFLIALAPVIGLVQVGSQSMADRYAYLPSIGLFAGLVWLAADAAAAWKHRELILGGASAVILGLLAWRCTAQVQYWHDSIALWRHCIAAGSDCAFVRHSCGLALDAAGEPAAAIDEYQAGLRLDPASHIMDLDYSESLIKLDRPKEATNMISNALKANADSYRAHEDMGMALLALGSIDEAASQLVEATRLNPASAPAWTDLGRALSAQGKSDEALNSFGTSLKLDPELASAYFYRGCEYRKRGATPEETSDLQKAVQLDPGQVAGHLQLAGLYERQGDQRRAVAEYRAALRLKPKLAEAMNNLAWMLATAADPKIRNGTEAVGLAERACELTSWQQTVAIGTLAAAYAEAGAFDKAVQTAQRACDSASAHGEKELLLRNRELMAQYKSGHAYHQNE